MATEDVYATLLLNDLYLPGALVLAHSLRDAGTAKRLAVLVTMDSVSVDAMVELQRVYDHVIPVDRLVNQQPQNLTLMDRVDLHSTFTKITLWKQLQFRRIVYMDADMVAWRAPDELFDIEAGFSAAPDIGWPDIFNTGLMVLTPNMGDYWALYAMAQRGISFDGADQGLLNMHFKNTYNRLSFSYNVTPSAHYQYIPAYRHFQSSISATHFIGKDKPWTQGRDASSGSGPFDEVTGRWWAVYDRHYRGTQSPTVQYYVKGEFQPPNYSYVDSVDIESGPFVSVPIEESFSETTQLANESRNKKVEPIPEPLPFDPSPAPFVPEPTLLGPPHSAPAREQLILSPNPIQYSPAPAHSGRAQLEPSSVPTQSGPAQLKPSPAPAQSGQAPLQPSSAPTQSRSAQSQPSSAPVQPVSTTPHVIQEAAQTAPFVAPVTAWDASRSAPPSHSKPEAANFPATQYAMSSDPTPYKAPERYPDPPKDMYYELPKTPTYQKPAPIFPWETKDTPKPTRVFAEDEDLQPTQERQEAGHITVAPSTAAPAPVDPWHSFSSNSRNAWDDIPEIEQYIGALQKNRKGNIQVLQGYGTGVDSGGRRASVRLTDFPTEQERPSLPVTPAPIRRLSFFDDEGDESELPVAEGVPAQTEWDPVAQLDVLARRQSEVLGKELGEGTKEIPQRHLPYGSEGVNLPNPIASPMEARGSVADLRRPSNPIAVSLKTIKEPSYGGPGTAWEKDESPATYETPLGPSEKELDAFSSTPNLEAEAMKPLMESSSTIEKPSYDGPGATWEKGEAPATQSTTLGPDENQEDVLAE